MKHRFVFKRVEYENRTFHYEPDMVCALSNIASPAIKRGP